MIKKFPAILVSCSLASLSALAMEESLLKELKGRVSNSPFKEAARGEPKPQAQFNHKPSPVAREKTTQAKVVHQNEEKKNLSQEVPKAEKREPDIRATVLAPELPQEEVFYNEGMSFYEKEDYLEAKNQFLKATEKKHVGAMYMLGIMFEQGLRGVPQSDGAACDWFRCVYERRGGEQEQEWKLFIQDAALRLANLYIHNRSGGQYRGDESIGLYRWLADCGDSNGQFKLGWIYYTGGVYPYEKLIRVDQDFAEAVKWLLRAAGQDHVEAMFFLGKLYAKGVYINRNWQYLDHDESRKWYQKAADKGHVEAYNALLRQ